MNTELAKASAPARALAEAVEDGRVRMGALLQSLGIDANNPTHQAALLACDKYGLDPLMKHVIVIPRSGPYVTRDGYLHVAHRSGQFDGMTTLDEGETPTHWWAKVAVYRKDMTHPFTYVGRYPKAGQNKAYGQEMAVTRAERTALARAFPVAGMVPGGMDLERDREGQSAAIAAELDEHVAVAAWVADNGQPETFDAGEITHAPATDDDLI